MIDNTDRLRMIRNSLFEQLGKKRWKRVLAIAFTIATIWIFADWVSGNLQPNLWHDALCLVFAIVVERLLPWGKPQQTLDTLVTTTPLKTSR